MYKIELTSNEESIISKIIKENIFTEIKIEKDRKIELIIPNDKSAELISEEVKNYLVAFGFDINYDVNAIGIVCERLIDKFYEIGW